MVDILADVREHRLFLAPVDERPVPQDLLFGLEAQIGKLLVILAPHFAVDLEEAREQVRSGRQRARGVDGVDELLHRSEERRIGKECRSRWWRNQQTQPNN